MERLIECSRCKKATPETKSFFLEIHFIGSTGNGGDSDTYTLCLDCRIEVPKDWKRRPTW